MNKITAQIIKKVKLGELVRLSNCELCVDSARLIVGFIKAQWETVQL